MAANDLSGHWAEDIIAQWREKGYVSGYADGSFRPDAPITRAAFAKLMNRAMGFTEEAAISFADVTEGDWYYHEVARAVSAGYTQGCGDGTFRPDKDITRAEAAAMIARVTGLTAQESDADGFSDGIPAWARGSVGAVAAAGFMIGYTDGTFGAGDTMTRASAVVALDRVAAKAQGTTTITEPDTTLEDKIIAGDLIVAESVGDGNIYLKNVTVLGDTYIMGGGSHSFYAENSRFSGTVYMQKDRLHMGLSGSTEMRQVQMEKPSSITFEKGFSGTVKNLEIPEGAPEGKYSIEAEDKASKPVENVNLDAKADLSIDANVSSMTIGEKAGNSTITVQKDAAVDSMEVGSKVKVGGKGTVDHTEVTGSGSVTTPAAKSSGGSGSSSGSSRPTVTIEPSLYGIGSTTSASNKFVSFKMTGATLTEEDLSVTVTSEDTAGSKTLAKDTDYKLEIFGNAITVTLLDFQLDTKYAVEVKASSVGSGRYAITGCTYEYGGMNKVTWRTDASVGNILPGETIGAGEASVTFTVDGAAIKDGDTYPITAELKGSAAETGIHVTDKIAVSTDKKTITVDLQGQNLSADNYTLTLHVNGYRLDTDAYPNRYAPENNTVTAEFTVEARPITLGASASTLSPVTSKEAIPADTKILFPVTGIASILLDGENPPSAVISGSSGITTTVSTEGEEGSVSNVVVTLSGTAAEVTEETIYTLTLTIPTGCITEKTGYYTGSDDPEQTFTFTVQPASAPEVTIAVDYGYNTLVAKEGESVSGKKLVLNITGASAVSTEGIKVIAFQGSIEAEFTVDTVTFTEPTTEETTGTLEINLTGVAPGLASGSSGAARENGLKVVIPKGNFTAMTGYTAPGEDVTVHDFKFVLEPASTSGE